MKPINFFGSNRKLGPPAGWDAEKDGDCDNLHVQITTLPSGTDTFTSVWVPSAEELAKLKTGSAIMVMIVGGQPPLMMGVTELPASMIEVKEIVQASEIAQKTHTDSSQTTPLPDA